MTTAQPSAAQRRLLETLAAGGHLLWSKGLCPHAFIRGSMKGVNVATVAALSDRGWLEVLSEDWHSIEYVISPAGKSVIATEPEQP